MFKNLLLECNYLIFYYEIFYSIWHFEIGETDLRHVCNSWTDQSTYGHVHRLRLSELACFEPTVSDLSLKQRCTVETYSPQPHSFKTSKIPNIL
jgi:hypothetical protein